MIRQVEEEVKVPHDKQVREKPKVENVTVKKAKKEEPFDFDEMIAFERLSNFSS